MLWRFFHKLSVVGSSSISREALSVSYPNGVEHQSPGFPQFPHGIASSEARRPGTAERSGMRKSGRSTFAFGSNIGIELMSNSVQGHVLLVGLFAEEQVLKCFAADVWCSSPVQKHGWCFVHAQTEAQLDIGFHLGNDFLTA